ncbi:hypothetical protein [Rhodococcus sp. RS1C4]|nr:hypothetical protein [Rhodococcus sp. RS1C4]
MDQLLGITDDWRNGNGAQWNISRDSFGYTVRVRVPDDWQQHHDSLEWQTSAPNQRTRWWVSDPFGDIDDALAVAVRQATIIRDAQQVAA